MIIKLLLILGLLTAAALAIRGKTSATQRAVIRLGTCCLLGLGVVAFLFPQTVTLIANAVGVTRGTDLILYILVVAFLLSSIDLYRKLHELEDQYVDLVRQMAITEAKKNTSVISTDSSNRRFQAL